MHIRFSSAAARRSVSLLGLAALALLPAAAHAAPAYTVTLLGTLPGGTESDAFGVNNSGQVVGYADTADGPNHAFLYSGGSIQDLGTLGGTFSYATAINNNGQITGNSGDAANSRHAFLYANGTFTDLGTLPNDNISRGYALNNSGAVVGASLPPVGTDAHGLLYANSALTPLGTPAGDTYNYAYGINDSGQVTGNAGVVAGGYTSHAYLDTNGVFQDLGTLPGGDFSFGRGLNNSGQVVGYGTASDGFDHAFLSGANGVGLTDFGLLPGGTNTFGSAVNDSGQAVGHGDTTGSFEDAFLYQNGTLTNLNALIDPSLNIRLRSADSISGNGYITGTAINADGNFEAYLLTPAAVPEASSVVSLGLLLAFGLGGVLAKKQRKA